MNTAKAGRAWQGGLNRKDMLNGIHASERDVCLVRSHRSKMELLSVGNLERGGKSSSRWTGVGA